jgi:hypothetical protein
MCAAGRKVVVPDVMSMTTWHTPCTKLGILAWQISAGEDARTALLCPQHDAEVRAGRAPWLREAVPLAPDDPANVARFPPARASRPQPAPGQSI